MEDKPQTPPIDYSRRYTVEEYFALEEQTGIRHEYYHGEIFPLEGPQAAPEMMAGGTRRHNQLTNNCWAALDRRLADDSPCYVYSDNVRTAVEEGTHFLYPDVVLTCERDDRDERNLRMPSLIVEVLSGSTERRDRGWKFQQYKSIASLKQYVLISQWQVLVDSYVRNQDDTWTLTTLEGEDAELVVVPLDGARIPLRELYRRVRLAPLRLWRNPEQTGG